MKSLLMISVLLLSSIINAKEVALSFDDSPMPTSKHFDTHKRTEELIRKLKLLNVPPVMIFANPCKRSDTASVIGQLKKYRDAGHIIANHTCNHPRFDEVGFEEFSKDAQKGDQLLAPLMVGQKFFRFPYLNESKDEKLRDQMREWLQANGYRNGFVSIDNDDYLFSSKINQAKEQGKKIDYKKVEELFTKHLIESATFYNDLAVKSLGRSPKHVILLHEMDATVMFIESLVNALRKDGWKIISVEEAYKDKLYLDQPKNTYAGDGLIAQIYKEKTGEVADYDTYEQIKAELNKILGLNPL